MNQTDYREFTDEQLILMLQIDEDIKAFDEIVLRYKDRIINFIFQYTNNRDDAEDLAQDSFLKLYRYRDKYKEIAKFSTWFYTIVINTVRNNYNRGKNFIPVSFEDMDESDLETGDNIYYSDEFDNADEKEKKIECLKKAFDMLDNTFKEIILLRYTEGLEYEKISEILGIPSGTVKSRINRGREHLKNIFVKLYRE